MGYLINLQTHVTAIMNLIGMTANGLCMGQATYDPKPICDMNP